MWTLSRDKKGFAVYMTFDVKGNGEMQVDGIAYVFSNSGDVWQTTGKMDVLADKKKLLGDDIKKHFPKRGKGFVDDSHPSLDVGWNFWDEAKNVVKADDYFKERQYWRLDQSNNAYTDDVKDWSANLDSWWKHFFDDGKKWNMVDVVNGIRGEWWHGPYR